MTDYAPTAFFREIAARIRGHVARFDVSQAELAILCDVSQSQLSKILRASRPMTIDQLAVICDALEIDLEGLIKDVQSFVDLRELSSSPIRYVEDEERVQNPKLRDERWLDPWGKSARKRILANGLHAGTDGGDATITPFPGVGGPAEHEGEDDHHAVDLSDDSDLAASTDDSAVDPDRGP